MTDKLLLAVPSKGRLMDDTISAFALKGIQLRKFGTERGYRGEIVGWPDIDVMFVSASEIARKLKDGSVHVGVTGEDLIREEILDADDRVDFIARLGFGHADVVVAVPQCWLDVGTMSELAEMARGFRQHHGRRIRVATKYMRITRAFFHENAVADYRVVESLGATEGTPASGTADLIVDITSTGATLKANGLKILDDGVILRSQANLVSSRHAQWNDAVRDIDRKLSAVFAKSRD